MKLVSKNHNKISLVLLSIILIFALFYRVFGLTKNSSFWIDETSSAGFARAIVERGVPVLATGYYPDNYVLHFYLMAASMKVFGFNEFAARFPSVIFGVLTIIAVFLLAKKIFNKEVGLLASLFIVFSIWEITMSRQARSYQVLQFFYVTSIFWCYWIIEKIEKNSFQIKHLIVTAILIACTVLTHMMGFIPWIVFFFYLLFVRFDLVKNGWNKISQLFPNKIIKFFSFSVLLLFSLSVLESLNFFRGIRQAIWNTADNQFVIFNHFSYYHSLVWRQYGLYTFLGTLGLIWFTVLQFKKSIFIWLVLFIQIGLVFFRFPEAYTRYLYSIFPIILIFFSYALWQIWQWSPIKKFPIILLGIFIVLNGYKFTVKPKTFYSANADMIELPEPDFKSAYQYIINRDPLKKFVLIDNRVDAAIWYLGEGYPNYYLSGQERAAVLRLQKELDYDEVSGAKYVTSADSLDQIIKQNPKGFVVLEIPTVQYAMLDQNIVDYIRFNLKLEKEFDKIAGNQSGDWPIDIYSWGYEK